MSDSETFNDIITLEEPEEIKPVKKVDKRKETSKANMAKARAIKLQQLKKKREQNKKDKEYFIYESESDQSDDNQITIEKKKKPKKQSEPKEQQGGAMQIQIDEIKNILKELSNSNKERKSRNKTVVNIVNPSKKETNKNLDNMKKTMLINL